VSNQAQGLVRNLALKAPLKPVLMAYAAYADELGYTWAGVEVIAFDTGYAPSTVKQARRELTVAGWLASKRRFGTSTITRLNLDRMASEAVDRGEGRRIHPELEFEPDSPENHRSSPVVREPDGCVAAGQPQLSGSRLTVAGERPAPGRLDGREPDEYSSGSRPVFISESSDDPSVDARPGTPPRPGPRSGPRRGGRHRAQDRPEGAKTNPPPGVRTPTDAPTLCALTLVTGLDFGSHRRPTTVQALELAARVDAALAAGLSLVEVRRHAQATVNAAKPPREKGNAVVYLINGLAPERLPMPRADVHQPEQPAAADSEGRRSALAAVAALPRARVPTRRPRAGTRVSNGPMAREKRAGDG